jgi:hypothetical protein
MESTGKETMLKDVYSDVGSYRARIRTADRVVAAGDDR